MYQRRQDIEQQRQMLAANAVACDRELLLLDGEIRALSALLAQADGE